MDFKLIPLMIVLTAVMLPAIGYPFFAFWRAKRRIAWNVVNAAFILQNATPDLRRGLDAEVQSLLPTYGLRPESFARAAPEVRLAMYSMAMQRQGVQPPGSGKPFHPMSSPYLARSAKKHIVMVRFLVEAEHRVSLKELDGISPSA
jgi:hypothetical protein